ncbi:oxidoreductase [Kickxella alabastrina]|uniref:oxidoreductase n=1 Tax=Kickxella alabastrina TaxID=61397 RepID=UPI00221F4238|nr:oxidoreductase [Kickxella alabastrina]KAI7833513.1 oxidoreductase [Kickxella alabastrina]
MTPQITRISLKDYVPKGHATLSDFVIEQVPTPTKDQLKDGQIILHPLYLSVDPYQRGRLSGAKGSYVESYVKGDTITNFLVGKVTASASKDLQEGDFVLDNHGKWQTEYIVDAKDVSKAPKLDGISPEDFVGVLSMPAFTAYYGAVVLAKPKAGETILVSSASGAVGQMVVQLAKAKGLRVVGVAGSDDKVEYVKRIGADAAFNYKTCGNFVDAIKQAAPQGIDIYFDNVGGEFLDAALANIKDHARIVICGAISQYNISSPEEAYAIKNLTNILIRKASITGFIILEHFNTPDHENFVKEVTKLHKEGKIKYRTTETKGLENAPQALLDLFSGKNFGKSIVKA